MLFEGEGSLSRTESGGGAGAEMSRAEHLRQIKLRLERGYYDRPEIVGLVAERLLPVLAAEQGGKACLKQENISSWETAFLSS